MKKPNENIPVDKGRNEKAKAEKGKGEKAGGGGGGAKNNHVSFQAADKETASLEYHEEASACSHEGGWQ